MRFLTDQNRWETDSNADVTFADWFVEAMDSEQFERISRGVDALETRYNLRIIRAMLEWEKRYPADQSSKESKALSQLIRVLAEKCTVRMANLIQQAARRFNQYGFNERGKELLLVVLNFLDGKDHLLARAKAFAELGRINSGIQQSADMASFWRALSIAQSVVADESCSANQKREAARVLSLVQHNLASACGGASEESRLYYWRAYYVRASLDDDLLCSHSLGNLSGNYLDENRFAEALYYQLLSLSLKSQANEYELQISYHLLGFLAHNCGEFEIAIKLYEKAMSLGIMGDDELLYKRTLALLALGRYEDAVSSLGNLSSTSSRCNCLLLIGAAYASADRKSEAGRYVHQAIDEVIDQCWFAEFLGEFAKEVVVARLMQTDKKAHRERALLQYALGNKEIAATEIEKALKAWPEDERPEKRHVFLRIHETVSRRKSEASNDAYTNVCTACRRGFEPDKTGVTSKFCPECDLALDLCEVVPVRADVTGLPNSETTPAKAFVIDKVPVTNELFWIYHRVMKLNWTPKSWDNPLRRHPKQPVTCISRLDCIDFCAWRSRLRGNNVRLPDQEEWLRAALGNDGRRFPWGDSLPDYTRAAYSLFDDEYAVPAPFGMFPDGASPFGALDMAGNVWEWTSSNDDSGNPVYLGGSSGSTSRYLEPTRATFRYIHPISEDSRDEILVGFRCIEEVEPSHEK